MPEPVPVLLMVRELGIGGSERQTSVVARTLDRNRFVPHVACFIDCGMRRAEFDAAQVPILTLPVPSIKSPQVIPNAVRLCNYIRQHRIQLFHAFDYPTVLFGVPFVRAFGGCLTLSSQRAHRDLMSPRLRRAMRFTDKLAHAIVVNSQFLRRHLTEEEHVPPQKVEVCFNGIDVAAFSPGAREKPAELAGASLVVGVVCALRPEKDLATLIQAFARIDAPRARLVIVGEGPSGSEWKALAEALQLGNRCLFAGASADVVPWLRAIDIFVLPSTSEGFSNALMEAMACGCCVVASNVGGNVEMIRNGETGFLFKQGDVSALADRLERLAKDDALRVELAQHARRVMEECYSVEASARRMADIYSERLASKRLAPERLARSKR